MSLYYKTNALYEHITANTWNQYEFVSGDMWELVYGDNSSIPKLLVMVIGVVASEFENDLNERELKAIERMKELSNKSNLPLVCVRFVIDINEIEFVQFSKDNKLFEKLTLSDLRDQFSEFGLPVQNTSTVKYLNDKTSSAYHKWQRNSLGSSLTVSDIDLWGLDTKMNSKIIFELKRSYYSLERWEPFRDDYSNFRLISNLCKLSELKFYIIYNQRIKTPFKDVIDKIKLFDVDFTKTPPITNKGIHELSILNREFN